MRRRPPLYSYFTLCLIQEMGAEGPSDLFFTSCLFSKRSPKYPVLLREGLRVEGTDASSGDIWLICLSA